MGFSLPNLILVCSDIVSLFLPHHLSLLPPSVYFLVMPVFELLVHLWSPGIFARLPLYWDALLLSLQEVVLDSDFTRPFFLPSRALSYSTQPSRILKSPKAALLKTEVLSLLRSSLLTLVLHHFMVTAAKTDVDLQIHNEHLLGENKIQHGTSPHWLLYSLSTEFNINTYEESLGLLILCCAVFPNDMEMVKISRDDQGF